MSPVRFDSCMERFEQFRSSVPMEKGFVRASAQFQENGTVLVLVPQRIAVPTVPVLLSRSETWVPKRGGLKAAGKQQESATFLQRSFFDVAVQFFVCCSAAFGPNDFRTAEKPMLQCSFCSAAIRKLQRNFRFRWWHVAGVGFRGVGFRTC